jgi:hypothetical protein
MKILLILFCINISCFFIPNRDCIPSEKDLNLIFQNSIRILEEKEIYVSTNQDKTHLNQLKNQFREKEIISDLIKGFSCFKKIPLKCEGIKSWRILDMYFNHEPFHYIYFIVENHESKFFVASYDTSLKISNYLGEIKEDYFSEICSYISQNSQNKIGENYILSYIKLLGKRPKIDILTDVDLNKINQIVLLEKILFK